ncbi:hypothetical protein E0H75_21190 [Kribbella capetownensis]|uniref:Uncharacterized protein n=1 Tax=Kribbella capetownensis TaxID=1572659 RepID=A0A4R0JRE4_9ACTN|nr:hypothetical protein [Kribbella capetownensis]TCC49060.1 hypothetical protein E0H75_21190 [Kribbella capetownensis]
MSSGGGPSWGLMLARRLGFGRSPLRRRLDRIQSLVVLTAVLVAVLMIPVAVTVSSRVTDSIERSDAVRRATLTQVQARALEETPPAIPEAGAEATSRVRVSWTDPAGWLHEGRANVPLGTAKDAEVTIWLDQSGAIATPPRRPGDGAAVGGAVGLSTAMVSWLLIAGLARLSVVPLDRRRLRDWDREWASVGPRWRHRST